MSLVWGHEGDMIMASLFYRSAVQRRAPRSISRFSANRPCGCSGFWMRVMIFASRRCRP
jgi:hypothetical protein